MIFVDSNIFIYAVGREHPLKGASRESLERAAISGDTLVTSAEVLQELVHIYLPVNRSWELDSAFSMLAGYDIGVWPLEKEDVDLAWQLRAQHPSLSARDLCHLASCRRRGVREVMTFDRALRGAFGTFS